MKRILLLAALFGCIYAGAQPKVVGHRGCRFNGRTAEAVGGPYENTLESLRYAQESGIYAAEFDVNLTKDGEIAVFHGPKLPGSETRIWDLTLKEAMRWELPGGYHIPSLEQWLKQAKKHPEMKIIMEIKKHPTQALETEAVEKSMALVRKYGMESQVEYTSFSEWILLEVHRIDPSAKTIFISSGLFVPDVEYAVEKGFNGISYNLDGFMNNPDIVRKAREKGIETTFWIVNDYELIDWAVRHGIDFVSTDRPRMARKYLDGTAPYGSR